MGVLQVDVAAPRSWPLLHALSPYASVVAVQPAEGPTLHVHALHVTATFEVGPARMGADVKVKGAGQVAFTVGERMHRRYGGWRPQYAAVHFVGMHAVTGLDVYPIVPVNPASHPTPTAIVERVSFALT
jgi:hypothetical protein